MTTGEKIRAKRKENCLTQNELGEKCGMAGDMIRQYETGVKNPKFSTIKKIAIALDTTVFDLMELTPDDENSMLQKVVGANPKQIEEYAALVNMSVPEFLSYMMIEGVNILAQIGLLGKNLEDVKYLHLELNNAFAAEKSAPENDEFLIFGLQEQPL